MPFQFMTLTFTNTDPEATHKAPGKGVPSMGGLFADRVEGATCVIEGYDEFEETVQWPQMQLWCSFFVENEAAAGRLRAAAEALGLPGVQLDTVEMRAHTDREIRVEELERHLGEEIERQARWAAKAAEAASETPQP